MKKKKKWSGITHLTLRFSFVSEWDVHWVPHYPESHWISHNYTLANKNESFLFKSVLDESRIDPLEEILTPEHISF